MLRSSRRASSIVAARASMTARACSATTLGRSPPSMNPTFSVNPRSWSRSAPTARICAASSSMALAPRVGSMPAWAGMPRTRNSNSPQPLRPVLTAPPGSAGSSTKTAPLRRASSSTRPREERLPRSSSAVHSMTTRDVGQPPGRGQRPHGQHPDDDARLHVEDPRSVQAAVGLAQRHPLDLSDRPDRVEMPEEHDLPRRRPGAEGRAQMRAAGGRRDALDRSLHLAESLRQPLAAAIDRGRIGSGRLQAHQLGQYADQPVVTIIAELTQGRHAS